MKNIILVLLFCSSLLTAHSQVVIQKTQPHDTLTKWLAPKDNPQFAGGTYTYDYFLWIRYNYRYKIVHDTSVVIIVPPVVKPKWSVMVRYQGTNPSTIAYTDEYGIKAVRVALNYSDYKDELEMHTPLLDAYVSAGYRLVLNLNSHRSVADQPEPWVHNLPRWRKFAKAAIAAYGKYTEYMPVENEENNKKLNSESVDNGYFDELNIVVEEGHAAGLKVTNGGFFMITEQQSGWASNKNYKDILLNEKACGIDFINMHDKHDYGGQLSTQLPGGITISISLKDKMAYAQSILPGMQFVNNEAGTTGDLSFEKKEYENAGYAFVTQSCVNDYYLSATDFKNGMNKQ